MRRNEILICGFLVVVSWVLAFTLENLYIVACMNALLFTFYILYLFKKLPRSFYETETIPLKDKICISLGLLYFISNITIYFVHHLKLIGRIGLFPMLAFYFVVALSAFYNLFIKRDFNAVKEYLWCFLRICLIILSNIFVLGFLLPYSVESQYKGNRLDRKIVRDGGDRYVTKYVDSLSNYITEVSIRDFSDENIDYVIYYENYPDKIKRIDTIRIEKK